MADHGRGILQVVHGQVARARVESARRGERARKWARETYVAAKQASEDPRAVALASAGAVAFLALWVAYATHNPVTESDVKTALGIVYAPRRAGRLVRRYLSSEVPLGAYVTKTDPYTPCYELLYALHEAKKGAMIPIQKLHNWLELAIAGPTMHKVPAVRTAAKKLHAWTEGTLSSWAGASVVDRALSFVATNTNKVHTYDKRIDPLLRLLTVLLAPDISKHKVVLNYDGTFAKAVANQEFDRVQEYRANGVKCKAVDAFFDREAQCTLRDAVEGHVVSLAKFLPGKAAKLMSTKAPQTKLKHNTVFSVDYKEPCVKTNGRLPRALFDDLANASDLPKLLAWASANVRIISTRGFDDERQMMGVLAPLSREIRTVCDTVSAETADDFVYLALAIRVLGHCASTQFEHKRDEILTVTFAAVVHVARRVAEFAQSLEPARSSEETTVHRDLNLFYEPQNVADEETVNDYAKLCGLLYEQNLLSFVAPGIEDDASGPQSIAQTVQGKLDPRKNVVGGWGYRGQYAFSLPPDDEPRATSAPLYFGSGRSWHVARAVMGIRSLRGKLASAIPSPYELVAIGASAILKRLPYATFGVLLWRLALWKYTQSTIKTHRIVPQSAFIAAMFDSTRFRTLNAACAALTAQEAPASSRASVLHMLDRKTGHVRIALDEGSMYAGIDVAPPSSIGATSNNGLFNAERIMMHFSRGHYGTHTASDPHRLGMHATHRVVGTPAALTLYSSKRSEHDAAIYGGRKIKITVDLAARQYALNVPPQWIEKGPDPRQYDFASSSYFYYQPETTERRGVLVAPQDRTSIVGGLHASIERDFGGATSVISTGPQPWSCILNPDTAVRITTSEIAMRNPCVVVRLLASLTAALMRDSIYTWALDGKVMITVPDPDPTQTRRTVQIMQGNGESTVETEGTQYTIVSDYSPWSSLFVSTFDYPGAPVLIEVNTKEGDPRVLCVYRQPGSQAPRACVLRLLPSRTGLAPEQSVDHESLTLILAGLKNSPCWKYVRGIHKLLSGSAVVPFEGEDTPATFAPTPSAPKWEAQYPLTVHETWGIVMGAARQAAETRGTKAENVVAEVIASKEMAPFLARETLFSSPELVGDIVRFEAATGKCVRSDQVDVIERAIASFSAPAQSEIVPVLMGAGKTAVIIPILVANALRGKTATVIVVVPSHLVRPMYLTLACVLPLAATSATLHKDTVEVDRTIKRVCVLSAKKMQQIVLERPAIFYDAAFVEKTAMIFDEIDGLMDPMTCEFRRAKGADHAHYTRNLDMEAYYRAVVGVVRGTKKGFGIPSELHDRLVGLFDVSKAQLRARDFSLIKGKSSTAIPCQLGVVSPDMHFSDIDMSAILTTRLFINASGVEETAPPHAHDDLPHNERNAARILADELLAKSGSTADGEDAAQKAAQDALAIVAMRNLRTYLQEDVVPFADIAYMCKARVAFSGTVEIPCAAELGMVTRALGSDSFDLGWKSLRDTSLTGKDYECETDAKRTFREVLRRANNELRVLSVPVQSTSEGAQALIVETVIGELRKRAKPDDITCVIDACGVFSGMSASDVTERVIGTSSEPKLEAVFVDEGTLHGAGCSERCFYFFTQQNSRGVDLPMRSKVKGGLIVRYGDTTLTEAAQAAFRMRLVMEKDGDDFVHQICFFVVGYKDDTVKLTVGALVENMEKTEKMRAAERVELHQTQQKEFRRRATSAASPDYTRSIDMSGSKKGALATATSTATSLSTNGSAPLLTAESKWYYKKMKSTPRSEQYSPFVSDSTTTATSLLSGAKMTELIADRRIHELTARQQKSHFFEKSTDYANPALSHRDIPMNARYVQHLAQRGAFYRSSIKPAGTTQEGKENYSDTPANAYLYFTMGIVDSTELREAKSRMHDKGVTLEITNRMFLEHARIAREYCIVIAPIDEPKLYVLATCADLILREIQDLATTHMLYVIAKGTVERRSLDMSLREDSDSWDETALFLIACVGANLTEEQEEMAIKAHDKYGVDGEKRFPTLLDIALLNVTVQHARLSEENARLFAAVTWTKTLKETDSSPREEAYAAYLQQIKSAHVTKRRDFLSPASQITQQNEKKSVNYGRPPRRFV